MRIAANRIWRPLENPLDNPVKPGDRNCSKKMRQAHCMDAIRRQRNVSGPQTSKGGKCHEFQTISSKPDQDSSWLGATGRNWRVACSSCADHSVAAGAISQNVYLFAASAGLSTVIRAWIDREAIANALGLTHDQQALLSQTIGYPGN